MKEISSKSYKSAQQNVNVSFNPARVNAPKDNPMVKTFNGAFTAFNIDGISALSPADATTLVSIQDKIRKKLRTFGIQVGF